MGNEIEAIKFGGAEIYNAKKTGVRLDENNRKVYCVWLENGAYAEYPEQYPDSNISYYAKDKKTGEYLNITEKVFDSGKTEKDGREYSFEKYVSSPYIDFTKVDCGDGSFYYEYYVQGFDGLKLTGSPVQDLVNLTNVSNSQVTLDNDNIHDHLVSGINCKNIVSFLTEKLDTKAVFKGFAKGRGYEPVMKQQ